MHQALWTPDYAAGYAVGRFLALLIGPAILAGWFWMVYRLMTRDRRRFKRAAEAHRRYVKMQRRND